MPMSWRVRLRALSGATVRAMNEASGITVHAFIRPGTPASAGPVLVTQIVDLYEFGVIGPGSEVWANLDVPNALWVLSDTSMFLRFVDVPSAGWVRLTRNSIVWGRVANDTSRSPSHGFSVTDMPMPAREHDTVAVAFRNTDTARMRAQFGAQHHAMHDFQIDHGSMRAIDLKANSVQRRPQLNTPTQFSRNHAGVRGLDLMACSTGPHMHKVIRENLESFTTFIGLDEFGRIKAAQQRISQVAEGITDPIVQKISSLRDIGPFLSDPEDDDTQAADEPALAAG
ncbi:hypothetical protein I3U30_15535 [Mycobacteroides abscessus subsp. massiliense]|nr:hypothetical protein A3N96_16005 [Mycobacteroides abscessus]MBN7339862.1 hypothetical protein [Mycobacteroides abscessus subsp. massiliense]MBN7397634.1 hypothetical protein [Mycobacteroides abscessus subsp. abscessus]AMU36385.1 hypothetical protein A3N98_15200 [Mycobacteroides abscessus]AMU41433.1 hypothetical protein A3N99_15795 [Mycobacteroides abscessus]